MLSLSRENIQVHFVLQVNLRTEELQQTIFEASMQKELLGKPKEQQLIF